MSEELRTARIEALQAKLKAREGKPGMAANVEAIKAQIAELETGHNLYRGGDGRFVDLEHMIQNPETSKRVET